MSRHLDDFAVGQVYRAVGRKRVDAAEIKRFAQEYDPQPFHLDEQAARGSFFGELVASGWHTACLSMRLLVDSEPRILKELVGAGFDELRWPRPVRPGDELRAELEVLDIRPSRSRPDVGLVKLRMTTLNQNGEAVLIGVCNVVAPRRKKQA